jgi:hypothetical protein
LRSPLRRNFLDDGHLEMLCKRRVLLRVLPHPLGRVPAVLSVPAAWIVGGADVDPGGCRTSELVHREPCAQFFWARLFLLGDGACASFASAPSLPSSLSSWAGGVASAEGSCWEGLVVRLRDLPPAEKV